MLSLQLWVHEPSSNSSSGPSSSSSSSQTYRYGVPLASSLSNEILLNPDLVRGEDPELHEGDVVEICRASNASSSADETSGNGSGRSDTLLFVVSKASIAPEGSSAQLQISVSQNLAQSFGFKNRDQVLLTKLASPLPPQYIADHVELYFKDQYLGRADMHRISLAVTDCCVYKDQKVQLAGLNIRARVGGVWVKGKQRKCALVTSETRTVFRSESAKYYIFLQLSKEMWQFDDDGSLFFEKALDLFLPELFSRWSKKGTNHIVSVVLFARIMYDKEETQVVQRPLMHYDYEPTEDGAWTDVYKVVVDLEALSSWKHVLYLLRKEIQNFRQEVYLSSLPRPDGRLAGTISHAHEGGILEAINMALSAFNKHYIDRDLQRTGLSIVIITAGTAHFNVEKNLLRLTQERMIDEGFGVDLVSLAKMPLHAVPLFKYKGTVPATIKGNGIDHLYTNDDPDRKKEFLYAIPHWVDSSFYAKHQDKPFRCDRFLARCRMSGIQDIGIAEYENASISLPIINDDLKVLEGYGPEWEQLSEMEKRQKTWERFDAIACGSLGKWETIQEEEQARVRKDRLKGVRDGSRSSMSLNAPTWGSSDSSSDSHIQQANRGRDGKPIPRTDSSLSSQSSETRAEDGGALQFSANTNAQRARVPPASVQGDHSAFQALEKPDLVHAETPSELITPRASPSRALGRLRSVSKSSVPFAGNNGRGRAGSVASSSTLSRQPSHLSLRSPSAATAGSALGHLLSDGKARPSAAPTDRRSASYSVPAPETATPEKAVPQKSATSVLSSLMAAQTKRETASNTSSGGWFWSRRKASQNSSPAKTSVPLPETPAKGETARSASPGTAVSRQPSASSAKKGGTALSVTPATPVTATTITAVQSSDARSGAHSLIQPISISSQPAAFKIATNDPLTDPRSLDEHSLHQYFFEAARQSGMNTRNLKARIADEKQRRAARLNPSNPARSSVLLQDQSRRWINIFPRAGRINNQRSVKWKSLCTPACLPLYTDYMPSSADLNIKYNRETYTLPVTMGMSSFLLRPGKDLQETAGNLLRELVNQRIAQSFQIIMPAYDDRPYSSLGAAAVNSRLSADDPWLLPSSPYIREILYNTSQGVGKGIYLNFSNVIHRLQFDASTACIKVTSWSERHDWSTDPFNYKFMLMPFGSDTYTFRDVTFSYPNLNTYDWKYLDRLIAGLEDQGLQEKTRYWRTRFILIPAEVPDFQGMLESQSKVLLEDPTEDDIRITGVMTLYEQFSKAKWVQPGTNSKQNKSTLAYTTTNFDPSVYASEEVERTNSDSTAVPLPEAYGEDRFFEDFSPSEIVQSMLEGTRPVKLQARRSGFRKIEESFTGQDFVSWLVEEFVDVPDRATALMVGNELVQAGVVVPVNPPKRLADNYTFYQVAEKYRPKSSKVKPKASQSMLAIGEGSALPSPAVSTPSVSMYHSAAQSTSLGGPGPHLKRDAEGRFVLPMSTCTIINLDPAQKSDRSETAFLHLDVAHNPANGFHFQLNWLGTSRLVDDTLSHWQRLAEKHGLKLVEENVRQIKDVSHDNPLQAAEIIKLAVLPPVVEDLAEIIGPGNVTTGYFQTQLLKSLGYILDVEGDLNFSTTIVSAEYSYRKEVYETSQFIHRSGTCFVQITESGDGFLFLKNRLYLSHHRQGGRSASTGMGLGLGSTGAPHNDPGELKRTLQEICENEQHLKARWEEILRGLLPPRGDEEEDGQGTEVGPSSYAPSERGTITHSPPVQEIRAADYPLPSSLAEPILPALSESPERAAR